MQTDKKLTLQQYIECHNIKKQLRQRSKEKSRSKSRDKTASLSNIPLDHHDTPLLSPNRAAQNHKLSTHQMLNSTLYDQVDYRARNLYSELQQAINEIKLECRAIIRNDKDFAFFLKLMQALINKFRVAVMQIHRQNILLFQMSKEADKTYLSERDDLARTHIQNLQRSFNEQYELSKSQYESNLNFVSHKTIKQKMQQNKKGEDMLKAIFRGLAQEPGSQKKVLKKYQTEAKDQKQRQERKQEAVNFLGFIMRNIGAAKKQQQSQPNQPTPQFKQNPPLNIQISPNTNPPESNINLFNQNQLKTTKTQSLDKKENKIEKIDSKQKKQDDKIVKNINYLNSRPKPTINTENIDQMYTEQNVSFQDYNPSIKSIQKLKVAIPKSPIKRQQKQQRQVNKFMSKNEERPHERVTNTKISEKQVNKQERVSEDKKMNKKITQVQPSPSPPTNRIQLIQRTNTKSKGKSTNKLSATKKAS